MLCCILCNQSVNIRKAVDKNGAGVTFCRAWIHFQILLLNFTTRNYLFTNTVTYYVFFISSFLNKSK